MGSEDVREHLQRALDTVVVDDVDLDEADALFEEYQSRIDGLRVARGEA